MKKGRGPAFIVNSGNRLADHDPRLQAQARPKGTAAYVVLAQLTIYRLTEGSPSRQREDCLACT